MLVAGGTIYGAIKCIFLTVVKQQKLLTLDQINSRIKEFPYGEAEAGSKPTSYRTVKPSCDIKLKSIETLILFRTLPFILHDILDPDSLCWKIYFQLASIVDIVFAPAVDIEWPFELETLIQDFYTLVLSGLRSGITKHLVRPKLHYLLHYPRLLKKYGNFRALYCLRFESFHTIVKNIVRAAKNCRNITHTCANRIQLIKLYEAKDDLAGPDEFSSGRLLTVPSLDSVLKTMIRDAYPQADNVIEYKQCKVSGMAFTSNAVYLDPDKNFVQAKAFFWLPSVKKLICYGKKIVLLFFERKFHSYKVSVTETDVAWFYQGHQSYHLQTLYKVDGCKYLRLRYRIVM